jgi:hypothetical protein
MPKGYQYIKCEGIGIRARVRERIKKGIRARVKGKSASKG